MADMKISGLPDAAPLTGAELILLSQGGADAKISAAAAQAALDWVRPADWTAMPASAANTIRLRFPVFDHSGNIAAVRVSVSAGTYDVDWGDGTSTTGVTSNTTSEHTYNYGDAALGAVTSRGYKTAIITLTPNTGGANITGHALNLAPTGTTAAPMWLEAQFHTASVTAFTSLGSPLLEYLNIVAYGTISGGFQISDHYNLQRLDLPSGFLTSVTSLAFCFRNFNSLKRLDLSSLGGAVSTIASGFQNLSRVEELVFPSGSLDNTLTLAGQSFSGCGARTISFPSGSLSAITDANTMFSSMSRLHNISFPAGAFAAVTNASSMFASCFALTYLEFPSGAFVATTNISTMFSGCGRLQHIKFPTGAFGSVTNATNTFASCSSLARIENCSIPVSFSIANCKLDAAALDEVYTALPTITSQTITVTGNRGTSGDTPSIATGKGWTVTG